MKRKITIKNLNDKIDIIVDKVKLICGDDFESRDKIKKVLINKFNKIGISDFAEDKHISEVLFDDEPININDFIFFCVDANYDLIQDTKLGSKSLALEYVNSLFDDIEYLDEYQTINNLLVNLLEERIENAEYHIKSNIECMLTKKLLVKLIELSFLNDDTTINNYDLTLEERIMVQLNMIKQISLTTKKNVLLLIECPIVSKTIIDKLKEFDVLSLVIFDKIVEDAYDDILILDKVRIDVSDEDALYELCFNDKTAYYTIEEMKNKMIDNYVKPRFI